MFYMKALIDCITLDSQTDKFNICIRKTVFYSLNTKQATYNFLYR